MKNEFEKKLLPFHIIEAATMGDVEAINVVLKHYESYMMNLDSFIIV